MATFTYHRQTDVTPCTIPVTLSLSNKHVLFTRKLSQLVYSVNIHVTSVNQGESLVGVLTLMAIFTYQRQTDVTPCTISGESLLGVLTLMATFTYHRQTDVTPCTIPVTLSLSNKHVLFTRKLSQGESLLGVLTLMATFTYHRQTDVTPCTISVTLSLSNKHVLFTRNSHKYKAQIYTSHMFTRENLCWANRRDSLHNLCHVILVQQTCSVHKKLSQGESLLGVLTLMATFTYHRQTDVTPCTIPVTLSLSNKHVLFTRKLSQGESLLGVLTLMATFTYHRQTDVTPCTISVTLSLSNKHVLFTRNSHKYKAQIYTSHMFTRENLCWVSSL
ncbi:hypothetical protein J6590_024297 [Homalodisca vitripennis]|nr:hypothetical protein J6590_024297 [Homalodisca vitripennis]